MRLLIMGAPGAGKGTQAKLISNHYRIPAISTGAIFRANIAAKTELGKRVDELIQGGNFVPDVITTAVVAKRLMEPDAKGGFLLDGYPRTSEQVEALDIILADLRTNLDCVVSLDVDIDQLVDRLLKRAQIEGRADDNEETIRHRMAVHQAETAELMDIYRDRGILVNVDGEGTVDQVAERIFAAIDKFSGR
ncbi:adenylate kinase [Luteococcus peritonei]|uniref:Adenylate kinase n=1 Tax=Luteococcus peritonei TaxID=88874 RepID=A0ABW4RRX2_9ACTN